MSHDYNYDELIRRFEAMLQTNENFFFDLEDFLDIIDYYINSGNYSMAQKAITAGLQQYGQNIEILLYKAELFSLNDQLENAEQLLYDLRLLDPERLEIPMLEAEIYSRKHLHKKAIAALQRALALPGAEPAEIYEMMTVEHLYLDNYNEALQMAIQALKYDPDSSMSLFNAVSCYDLTDRSEEAIVFLENFLQQNPFSEVGWSLLAKKYIDKAQYKKALKAIDFAIAIDDKFIGAYYDKAYIFSKLRRYEEALVFYKLTLQIADPTAFAYYHIARIYQRMNDANHAAEFYFKAINEDPGHYKSWIKLVQLKMSTGEWDAALEIVKKALEIVSNQELFELLGDIYLHKKDWHKAIPAFEMSLKLGETKLPVILKLSDLYKQTHQIDKFRNLLLEAKQQFPDSKEIQSRMSGQ